MRLLRPAGEDRDDGTEKDDAALVRAVARGETDALGALYDRHAGWLHARLVRRCADAETVREVLQDTFVTVWRSAASHRGAQVGGWLWVIASRRLVDALRADARADRPLSPSRPAPEALAPSAEDRVLAGLEYGDVGTALAGISPELREVLRATVVDGLSTRRPRRCSASPRARSRPARCGPGANCGPPWSGWRRRAKPWEVRHEPGTYGPGPRLARGRRAGRALRGRYGGRERRLVRGEARRGVRRLRGPGLVSGPDGPGDGPAAGGHPGGGAGAGGGGGTGAVGCPAYAGGRRGPRTPARVPPQAPP